MRSLSVALLFTSTLAFAQGTSGPPQMSYEAVMAAPVGSWAEYITTMQGQTAQVKIRYALVERTAKKMSIEIDGQTPLGPLLMRMDYEPAPPDGWKLAMARMQMGTGQVQEMPVPKDAAPVKKGAEMGTPVGGGAVKTSAGTFDCKQFRRALPANLSPGGKPLTFDLWVSPKAMPVGLVKQTESEGRMTTVLAAMGGGATAKLTGEGKPAGDKPAGDGKAKGPELKPKRASDQK
jgi:hypothetical protein